MLELLQESLVFLKEQYEMLMCLKVIIDQRRERCRSLLSQICKQIIEEIQKAHGLANVLTDANKTGLPSVGNVKKATMQSNIEVISNKNIVSTVANKGATIQICSTDTSLKNIDTGMNEEEIIQTGTMGVISENQNDNSTNMNTSTTNHDEIIQTGMKDVTKTNTDVTNVERIPQTHSNVTVGCVDDTDSHADCVVDLTTEHDDRPIEQATATKPATKKAKPHGNRTIRKYAAKRKSFGINVNTESNHVIVPKSMKPSAPKFKCDYCGDLFEWKSHLYKHVLTSHTGEPYHCNICNKSFQKKSSFVLHKQRHVNNLKCPFCGEGFERVSELTSHECKNTGGESFMCTLCKVSFPRKDLLDCHFVLHSNAVG